MKTSKKQARIEAAALAVDLVAYSLRHVFGLAFIGPLTESQTEMLGVAFIRAQYRR